MSRTTSNRRKKVNRRFQKCQQCGAHESVRGLCYVADELDNSPDPVKCFCSGKCVDRWRMQHELLVKNFTRYFACLDGTVIKATGDKAIFNYAPPRAIYIATIT